MARVLTRQGFLMASGGGPGAMEATHLGASLATQPDDALPEALRRLSHRHAALPPDASKVITQRGKIDNRVLRKLHAWLTPAYTLSQAIKRPGESLAVPTWYYGHEPTSPFASHIAKYFQNSLREDGLITLAAHGIIFAQATKPFPRPRAFSRKARCHCGTFASSLFDHKCIHLPNGSDWVLLRLGRTLPLASVNAELSP